METYVQTHATKIHDTQSFQLHSKFTVVAISQSPTCFNFNLRGKMELWYQFSKCIIAPHTYILPGYIIYLRIIA